MNSIKSAKYKVGVVISDKMTKTRVVIVERKVRHQFYGKIVKRKNKFKIHDAQEKSHVGDVVRIQETRPLSATKRWRLVEIVKKAQ